MDIIAKKIVPLKRKKERKEIKEDKSDKMGFSMVQGGMDGKSRLIRVYP